MAGVWAQLLGVDRVGATDNFFELGGHSLLATQVISRIRDVFGADVSVATMFDQATVRDLADAVEGTARGLVVPPVRAVGRDQVLPLSFAQQRLWFLDHLEPGSTEYNLPLPIRLDGALDVAALGAALDAVVARHEVLRTRLSDDTDGVAYQVIDPTSEIPMPVVDVSSGDDPLSAAERLIAQDTTAPFDLATGPLIRAVLIRLAADEHVLALSMHHVVFDEWSGRILRRELGALYEAFRASEPDPLPPLPAQYADFAVWQREWLADDVLDSQLDYWHGKLDALPVLELPTDRPRPQTRSSEGGATGFTVPAETAKALRALSRASGATMFMTLLAAFDVVLGRYCGTDDVVVGTPVANRNRAETEDLIGFFVNTLVMRTDLSGDPSFVELLDRVRETALGAYAHQDLPFEQLVDALVTERDRSRTPLFQVFFNYAMEDPRDGTNLLEQGDGRPRSEVRIKGADTAPRDTLFDLTLRFGDAGEGELSGEIEYSTALFDPATAERLARSLVAVLDAVADDAGQRVADVPLVSVGEVEVLVGRGRGAELVLPGVGGVHELIAGRAAVTPDAVAVVSGDVALSYGGLMVRASRLARHLRGLGVGAESVVGLCLERGVDLVVAVVGVWLSGAAYVSLDPDYPVDRLGFMLADSGAGVLVGHRDVAGGLGLEGAVGAVVWLDDPTVQGVLEELPAEAPEVSVVPDQLVSVIYTSGSTGRPKGVWVSHGALVGVFGGWEVAHFGVGVGLRWLTVASASFDVFSGDVVRALCSGGVLVVGRVGLQVDVGEWVGVLEGAGVNALECAPRYVDELVGYVERGCEQGLGRVWLGDLRLVVVTTDVWRWGGVVRARSVLGGGVRLLTGYGVTEAAVDSTFSELGRVGAVDGPVPIGGPLPNTRVYVLDERLGPVPVGVAGELFIAGGQLARGYGGRAGLTAERFVADPFVGDGSRMYRSGDRVRWLVDGELEFLGRADEQVKVRGYRIEPAEIETVLAGHDGIRTAIVAARGAEADRRLVAYLVPAAQDEGIPSVGDLRAYVGARLPDFMVPSVFVELDELPLTPNGKVDRAALPEPDGIRPDLDGFQAPATATEELLAGIWAQVLGVDRVGTHDNFFELGGHSLLATQVVSRIRTVFRVEVPLSALFDRPTVRDLASVVENSTKGIPMPPVTRVGRDEPLPLSFAQQRLWFLNQLDPGSLEYNVPLLVRWPGDLDVEALVAALSGVLARHEVLRTRLVADAAGVVHQVIDPPAPIPLSATDVSWYADPVSAARELVAAEVMTPFDLAAGPLIRATLIRVAPDEHVLTLAIHHVAFDEWSVRILRRELTALYEAFRAEEADPLPPLPVQYADFAVWQREWLTGEVLDEHLSYWRQQLRELPALELPTDRPRPAVRSPEGAVTEFTVSAHTADALRALSRKSGATMSMTLLAALKVLLGWYAGTEDVVVGTPVANRNRAETEDLIGFFVNTLVLRTDLSGDPSFKELLGRVRHVALAAYAHQDLPFEHLVDDLVVERDRSRTALFQVFFNYTPDGSAHGADHEARDDTGADGSALAALTTTSVNFDLSLMLGDRDGGLAGAIEYSTALFDAATMERMAEHLVAVLEAVAGDAGRRVGELPVLGAGERRRVVEEWNEVVEPLPGVGGVHELIAARALGGPDAVAVVADGGVLTYGGLMARANRLAHRLRGLGVGAESVVGLCLPRGVDMVVAMLAVWQAGGAYLPLDPEYPVERLEFMLADSGAQVLIRHRSVAEVAEVAGMADGLSVESVVWLDDPAVTDGLASTAPEVLVRGDQLAYVIYTSGSTGRPKGVQVAHRSVVGMVTALAPVLEAGPGGRVLQFASFSFDAAVLDVAVTLASGGALVVASSAERTAPEVLTGMIGAQGVTAASVVPSLLGVLSPDEVSGIQTLLLGAERLTQPVARAWAADRRLVNTYGPTEATVMVTTGAVDPDAAVAPPIGAPVANARLYVLDARLNPVPVGVAGEVFIAGPQVARGYRAQPALTAERFLPDPFTADGTRMYRSGDRARWLADGQLDFIGRADDQVKVRGFRIEPGEIEAVLTTHLQIRNAVVTAFGDTEDRRLVAYLVPADAAEGIPTVPDLRDHVQRSLPAFMVPAVFMELAALPLTPNGKLDRAALPEPDGARPELDEFEAVSGDVEEVLARLWVQLLGVERVGATDNFFELGGHSLLATQVISRIRELFELDIPLAVLFDQPTVRGLAAVVEERIWYEVEHMSEAEVLQSLDVHEQGAESDENGVSS
ncbi:amino acid adenylation domain-containing protein [Streptomyces sp. NPDC019443]|uniref:amino acid adenylation domain-containing protein n=1 Tax=Streptomyces sp. NPDC019443 TaxID=3365061 RepID=UPI003788B274